MENEMMLTLYLKDGRTLSGVYHWATALYTLQFAIEEGIRDFYLEAK